MVFSSLTFLLLFFPALVAVYYWCPKKARNYLLLVASLLFYGFGEPKLIGLLIIEILWNYCLGLLIEMLNRKKRRIFPLVICLTGDLGALVWFKYAGFLYGNVSNLFGFVGTLPEIALPIGISFYTFQGISYVVDVYRGTVKAQENPFFLGLYISLFPQLIAGPIVRYKDISEQIMNRQESFEGISGGFFRFCVGLCKKVLLANQLGLVTGYVFSYRMALEHSGSLMLLAAVAFTLQLYYDFSGYSDMAIGLCSMFGFRLTENFADPYLARTATDFWHRWHISLSTWFRDYVFIPLGGSRGTNGQTVRNLMIVWLLTGLWHGANWPCIIWGLAWGLMLCLEKMLIRPDNRSIAFRKLYRAFLLCFITMVTPLLKMDHIEQVVVFFCEILTASGWRELPEQLPALRLWLHDEWPYLLVGLLASLGSFQRIKQLIADNKAWQPTFCIAYKLLILLGSLVSISSIVYGSYNPFLYYQF